MVKIKKYVAPIFGLQLKTYLPNNFRGTLLKTPASNFPVNDPKALNATTRPEKVLKLEKGFQKNQ